MHCLSVVKWESKVCLLLFSQPFCSLTESHSTCLKWTRTIMDVVYLFVFVCATRSLGPYVGPPFLLLFSYLLLFSRVGGSTAVCFCVEKIYFDFHSDSILTPRKYFHQGRPNPFAKKHLRASDPSQSLSLL